MLLAFAHHRQGRLGRDATFGQQRNGGKLDADRFASARNPVRNFNR